MKNEEFGDFPIIIFLQAFVNELWLMKKKERKKDRKNERKEEEKMHIFVPEILKFRRTLKVALQYTNEAELLWLNRASCFSRTHLYFTCMQTTILNLLNLYRVATTIRNN